MGCSSRMGVPVPNKWYSGAAFMGEQCSGPFTGDSRLCVHHFLIESVQQYIMFISLQSAGIFFQHRFYTSGPERIHTVATHPAVLTTTFAVFLEF